MAPSTATKIYPFEDYQRKSPLKNRKDGFEGLMRIVKSLGVLSRPQRCLLGIIVSACFDDGVFTKSKAWLCQEYDGAYSTICRLLNQLDSIGFIELDGRGANQRIFPTELCYIDDQVELKKQWDLIQKENRKTDTLVLKNDRKSIKNENSTYISSKNFSKTDTAPHPEPPSEPPPNPPESLPKKSDNLPPKEPVAAKLENYKKSIHPDIIAAGLSDETILQVCDGADYQEIIWASDKALKPHVDNKPGYFRRMMQLKVIRSNPVKSQQIRLEKVPYPDFYSVPKEHTDKIECYNRNCGNTTCPTILINAEPSEGCIKYCPFLNSRRTES